jgi:hypothetical protein
MGDTPRMLTFLSRGAVYLRILHLLAFWHAFAAVPLSGVEHIAAA